jgi:hypothetical protein
MFVCSTTSTRAADLEETVDEMLEREGMRRKP